MAGVTRELTWGQHLHYVSNRRMKAAAVRIGEVLGGEYAGRTTYRSLFSLEGPPQDPKDALRAWLMLTALGEEPSQWGVSDDVLPPGLNAKRLRHLLRRSRGCVTGDSYEPELAMAG